MTPFQGSTPDVGLSNALYFLILIAVSATVFYFLLKRRSKRVIRALIVVALTTAALLLSFVYLSAVFANFPSLDILLLPLMIIITVLFDLSIFKFGNIVRNIAVVLVGGALGIFLANELFQFGGLYSVILILAFLAVYDVVAVYRGPVGKIASSSGLDELQGLSFSFKDIQMGLGDLVFYSMLVGAMFFKFLPNILPFTVSFVGVLAGAAITFLILERRNIFPGLPFPILLGLASGLIVGFLL